MRLNRKTMLQFLSKCKVAERIEKDFVICVVRAEGYDIKRDNAFWKLEGNKSKPRDVNCTQCGHQVVMSNNAYRDYIANGRVNQVACMQCALNLMKHEK